MKQIYQLEYNMTKLLGTKLIGDAAEWFHSVPERLSMTVDETYGNYVQSTRKEADAKKES